jgi:hypothetical protein
MSEAINYTQLSETEFSEMLEEGYCNKDPLFYEEFKRRMDTGTHYDPNTDPQALEKSNAAVLAFMKRVGLPHTPPSKKKGPELG